MGRLIPSKKQTVAISDTVATKSESSDPVLTSVAHTAKSNSTGAQPSAPSSDASIKSSVAVSFGSSKPSTVHRKQVDKRTEKNENHNTTSVQNDAKNASNLTNSQTQISPQPSLTDGKGGLSTEIASEVSGESTWTQIQQKQLEQAMAQFPKSHPERWTCIANAVPGKTKVNVLM